jgi:hypothetical protein
VEEQEKDRRLICARRSARRQPLNVANAVFYLVSTQSTVSAKSSIGVAQTSHTKQDSFGPSSCVLIDLSYLLCETRF